MSAKNVTIKSTDIFAVMSEDIFLTTMDNCKHSPYQKIALLILVDRRGGHRKNIQLVRVTPLPKSENRAREVTKKWLYHWQKKKKEQLKKNKKD